LLVAQLDPEGIRARIREARKAAGLTQQEMADALEVHKRTVENYERFRVPDYKMLNQIARVTDRPLEWFLHGAGVSEDDRLDAALAELGAVREQVEEILALLREPPARRRAKP
jgi:transcriptional regulator with XRE-family HTH domain